jgi:hypothetical protein
MPSGDREISHAAAYPVHCARAADLGCLATRPGGKFAAIAAHDAGWFSSRRDDLEYCPEHVPDWVPAWRARQAAKP